ncbi:MAG: hypothetical protein HRK26_00260 [Rickettsiaceae bacterium H1]|nr:hypothetical protein [Rickettsiaceae bacterium H1]
MSLVNIPRTKSYKLIFSKIIRGYKNVSSWLIYGFDDQEINDIVLSFARQVLDNKSEDLLQVIRKDGYIGVEEVRKVKSFLSTTSSRNGYKIALIGNAAEMNKSAANAILKMLEEPPKKSVIILVSNSLHRVQATIRSRCCKLYCPIESGNFILSEEYIDSYKKILSACIKRADCDVEPDKLPMLLQILVLRVMKAKLGSSIDKEIFLNERLILAGCDLEDLYGKWQDVLQLNRNKAKFHLAENQVNVLLRSSFYDYSM